MPEKIKIAITTPCHENWQDMSVADKGRFCNSCQKNVVDFTGMPDHEVTRILKADKNTCGRFLETQLNRELIAPTEKSSLWMAASIAVLSFIGPGTSSATAQQIPATEQLPSTTDVPDAIPRQQPATDDSKTITGTITSKGGKPLKGITVTVKNSLKTTITGEDGKFTINATAGDILHITGYNITGTNIAITKHTPDNLNHYREDGKPRNGFSKVFLSMAAPPQKISIPSPCHENWQDMTPVDKGRFCASCQKVVVDLTNLSDREIAAMVQKDNQLCGHARKNQLDRNLVIPSEKSNAWVTAGAAAVSLLTIGNNNVAAQTPVKTEQTESKTNSIKDPVTEGKRIITGTVSDESGPVADAVIRVIGKPQVAISDINGKFEIEAVMGDRLLCQYFKNNQYFTDNGVTIIDGKDDYAIKVEYVEISEGIIITSYKRTFFGRIFHSIGNLFR